MAKDDTRSSARPLGERAGALLGQVTSEEVERAARDAEESDPATDARARAVARDAVQRRTEGNSD